MTTATQTIPAHVPPELVMDYSLVKRRRVMENPHETLIRDVHANMPDVFYVPDAYPIGKPGWIIRRAEHLRQVYRDTENFSKKGISGFANLIGEEWNAIPTDLDPPVHDAFRAALNPVFSPKKMAQWDAKVRGRAQQLADKFKDKGECEFFSEFAEPFPCSIFMELMGLPQERSAQFLDWEKDLLHATTIEKVTAATRAVKQFLLDIIAERRKNPQEDLITNAINLQVAGRPMTDIEIFGHCFNLYVGGLDTVTSNISLHFRHLAENLEDQRFLRANPDKIPNAVEELLRAYAAVTTFRSCVKETTIGGVTIMPGDKVGLPTPLAGRDPAEYPDVNEVKLDRELTHLTFGFGPHRCLGSHLARREIIAAYEILLETLPEFTVKPGERPEYHVGSIIHVPYLPLVWSN